jgi:hypothetical protein
LLMSPPPPSPDPTRRLWTPPLPNPNLGGVKTPPSWKPSSVGSIVQVGPPSHKNRWPHVLHLLFHLSSHPISGESSSRR